MYSGLTLAGNLIFGGDTIDELNGTGLVVSSGDLNVGAGTCITVNADDVAVTSNCTDAATVDSIEGASLLRSDTSDNYTSGTLTFDSGTTLTMSGTLNGGGTIDFGGATSLEIPNGTGPTVNATGEIALDTTDNQLLVATSTTGGGVVYSRAVKRLYGFTVGTTTATTIDPNIIPLPSETDGYTAYHVQCWVWGGTSVAITMQDGDANATNSITCTTASTTQHALVTNNTFTAGEGAQINIGTISGSVYKLGVAIYGIITRE
jgi:hypothetical protein